MLLRRIGTPFSKSHGGHAIHPELRQSAQGPIFITCTEHRRAQANEVLDDFRPAYAAMDLDEVTTSVDLGSQRATCFKFSKHFAAQCLDRLERVAPGPQPVEGRSKPDLLVHAAPCKMMSAARSALL